jgi:hypothetical protein
MFNHLTKPPYTGLGVLHYARSAMYVARYHVLLGGRDLDVALDYLTAVAQSNAEEVAAAAELLKKAIALRAAVGGPSQPQAGLPPAAQ